MKHTVSRWLAILLAQFSMLCYADFELGLRFYDNKQFDKAFPLFLEAAQYGDYDAQNNVGVMYYRGEHVNQHIPTAYAWFALAAQSPAFKEKGLHERIFARLSDEEKKVAEEKFQSLVSQYGDDALGQKLVPDYQNVSTNQRSARVLVAVIPEYPEGMLRFGKQGIVDVLFTIDKYGNTRDHLVLTASSRQFEREAIKAMRKHRFEPATVNGSPVDENGYRRRMNFILPGAEYDTKVLEKLAEEKRSLAVKGNENDKLSYAMFLSSVPLLVKEYKPKDNPNEWFMAAAQQGSSTAGFFLGRNILYGDMCTQDTQQSYGWLTQSAKNGLSEAQYMLAMESFSGARFEKNEEKGFYWLARAAEHSAVAKVRYAWLLSTYPDENRRDGKLAAQLLDKIDKQYYDLQGLYSARAAVAAENKDFKKALRWQKALIEDAEGLGLPHDHLKVILASYQAQKPWRETP